MFASRHFTEPTTGYWQRFADEAGLPHGPRSDDGPWRYGYPVRLPDGRLLLLPSGVVMRQGERWVDTLGPGRTEKVVGVIDTPLLRAVPEGWVSREGWA